MNTWYVNPPHHCNDGAFSILVHDIVLDDYFVVYVLWQETPVSFHVEGEDSPRFWSNNWRWRHVDEETA